MLPLVRLVSSSARVALLPKTLMVTSSRGCGWTKDWMPGPPPKTPEERAAAARRYNLIPEDYDTYPEEDAWGDYPKLPMVGMDARDPYDDWDHHYYRRNYGEPLHHQYDMMTAQRNDPNARWPYPGWHMALQFIGMMTVFYVIYEIFEYFDLRICQQVKPKQFPGPGKVHYTFEPAYD